MKKLFLLLFCFVTLNVQAQIDTSNQGTINVAPTATGYSFRADLPALNQIPGGRAPFYTYFWDFGDGHFSKSESPTHSYTKTGSMQVQLYGTGNYDLGKPPTKPKLLVYIDRPSNGNNQSDDERIFLPNGSIFKLDKNCDALPGSEMVVIAGVKPSATKGKIYILSNEKQFDNPGFSLAHQSQYNGEKMLVEDERAAQQLFANIRNASISQSGSANYGPSTTRVFGGNESLDYFKNMFNSYKSIQAYEINGAIDQQQFSFLNLNISEEFLKDTNTIVTITGIYFPENSSMAYVHQLEIPIVASHDPNRMASKQKNINYRKTLLGRKLNYKIQFQNNGEGDAKNIKLAIRMPEEVKSNTFKLQSLYPDCPPCSEEITSGCWEAKQIGTDSLTFNFKGISLPGSKASDHIDYDSTKGYIRFDVNTKKYIPRKTLQGRTAIYFDKNEPVITNFSNIRFKKGLSPIVFTGYNFERNEGNAGKPLYKNNAFIGLGIAPLAPYKKLYWQAEFAANYFSDELIQNGIQGFGQIMYNGSLYTYDSYDYSYSKNNVRLALALLPIKYNVNSFLSIGAGLDANIIFNVKKTATYNYHLITPVGTTDYLSSSTSVDPTSKLKLRPFADLNLGKVYIGPSLGIRYYLGLGSQANSLSTYL